MQVRKKDSSRDKRMPPWMWNTLAHCLGVQQYQGSQRLGQHGRKLPPLAVGLQVATLGSALMMLTFVVVFTGLNIESKHSKTDILDGLTVVAIVTLYAALGTYAHRLSRKLFVHPKFTDMTRLHSKTVAKMNAALLVFVMMAAFIVAVNLHMAHFVYSYSPDTQPPVPSTNITLEEDSTTPSSNETVTQRVTESKPKVVLGDKPAQLDDADGINPCQKIDIPLWICQTYWLNQVLFSCFFLLWNGVVAMVLVSVSRTHTVSIRRFIRLLDFDAYLIDRERRKKNKKTRESDENLFQWIMAENGEDITKLKLASEQGSRTNSLKSGASSSVPSSSQAPSQSSLTEEQCQENAADECLDDIQEEPTFFTNTGSSGAAGETGGGVSLELHDEVSVSELGGGGSNNSPVRLGGLGRAFSRFRKLSEDVGPEAEQDDFVEDPHIMTSEEILNKHWKLVATTQLTSRAMQRWMCCMTICILFYTTIQIVYWFSHAPTLTGVLSFVCPLLILPLLASAYAEVNYEGQNLVQAIMPTEDRTHIFRYLYGMPVQLTVYGHPITFATMSTVLAAIMAAFASKILIKSMTILD